MTLRCRNLYVIRQIVWDYKRSTFNNMMNCSEQNWHQKKKIISFLTSCAESFAWFSSIRGPKRVVGVLWFVAETSPQFQTKTKQHKIRRTCTQCMDNPKLELTSNYFTRMKPNRRSCILCKSSSKAIIESDTPSHPLSPAHLWLVSSANRVK